MRPTPSLVAGIVVLCAAAGVSTTAQFRRGILAESTEVMLFRPVPPALLLPAGTFEVDIKNLSTGPSRLLSRFDDAITTQIGENDSRLRLADGKPDLQIVATLTEWTLSRRRGTRYVSETRQIGTKEVVDSKGNKKTEPVYEYGRNKPTTIDEGAATVRVEVRRGTQVLADESARVTFHEDRLVEEGPRSTMEIEDALLDRAAQRAAGLITPAREPVRVLLARSDEVDKLNDLARSRKWHDWRAALQETRPHRDPRRDAYRLHNLGIAHEALAYESTDDDETQQLITTASTLVQQAIAARKDEKYFTESFSRISASSLGYTRLRAMRASLGMRQTSAPASSPSPAAAPSKRAAAATDAAAMSNADVIALRKAGLDDTNLIASIRDAGAVAFDLSPAGLQALLSAKVSNAVIAAMREKAKGSY